jgi:hypothetical protein
MRGPVLKWTIALLICSFTNAVMIGLLADHLHYSDLSDTGRPTFGTYFGASLLALTNIILYGRWLLYIPALLVFYSVSQRLKEDNYLNHVLLGAVVGYVGGVICLLLTVSLENTALYTLHPAMPHRTLSTLPGFGIVGAVYGFVYRRWFLNTNVASHQSK